MPSRALESSWGANSSSRAVAVPMTAYSHPGGGFTRMVPRDSSTCKRSACTGTQSRENTHRGARARARRSACAAHAGGNIRQGVDGP
eukprot:364750-Chlamydomonas_euryale.AAC.3